MKMKVRKILTGSRANGPGKRTVIWLQGCSRQCPGCFNKETWDPEDPRAIEMTPKEVFDMIEDPGVTLTGGEPLEQSHDELRELLIRCHNAAIDSLMFTGQEDVSDDITVFLDIVVMGPYDQDQPSNEPLLGSANQKIMFSSDRWNPSDIVDIPRVEYFIKDGTVIISGFPES